MTNRRSSVAKIAMVGADIMSVYYCTGKKENKLSR